MISLKDGDYIKLYILFLLLYKLTNKGYEKECKNTTASVVGAASPHSQGRTTTAA
jgi:hypothetical protein